MLDAFEYIISEIEQGRGGLEGITLLLFFSPLSSLLFPLFFLFSLSAPSDLQANSMEILPRGGHQFCAICQFLVLQAGIFLVLHNQLGVHYSLYFSFASAFWGASSTCVGTAPGLKAGRTQRFLSPLSPLRAITATAASPPAASI